MRSQVGNGARSGDDDGLGSRRIEGADLALVARQPWRIFVTQAHVQRQTVAEANVVLNEELLIPLLPAEVIRRISARDGVRIAQQKVCIGVPGGVAS